MVGKPKSKWEYYKSGTILYKNFMLFINLKEKTQRSRFLKVYNANVKKVYRGLQKTRPKNRPTYVEQNLERKCCLRHKTIVFNLSCKKER